MYTTYTTQVQHAHIPHRCNIQYTCIPHTYDRHKTNRSNTHKDTIISETFSSFLLFYVFSWARGIRALDYLLCRHVQVQIYLIISNSWGR